jgi:hypothetical protein
MMMMMMNWLISIDLRCLIHYNGAVGRLMILVTAQFFPQAKNDFPLNPKVYIPHFAGQSPGRASDYADTSKHVNTPKHLVLPQGTEKC